MKFCERSIPAKGRRRAWCGSRETGGPSISGERPGTVDCHSAPEILSLTRNRKFNSREVKNVYALNFTLLYY